MRTPAGLFLKFLFFLLAGLYLFSCAGRPVCIERPVSRKTVLDRVLETLYLERDDLGVEISPDAGNPFLLSETTRVLRSPLQGLTLGREIGESMENRKRVLTGQVQLAAGFIDLAAAGPVPGKQRIDLPGFKDRRALAELYASLVRADALLREAFNGLSDNETVLIRETLLQLLFSGPQNVAPGRKASQDRLEKVFRLAASLRLEKIVQACCRVTEVLDRIIDGSLGRRLSQLAPGTIHTPLGDILVGSRDNDVYEGKMPLLIIEPGGDDIYRYSRAAGINGIIDICGNDVYTETGTASFAAGILGLGFLLDMSGDDLYLGGMITLGAGFMGAGILADLDGDDRYLADVFGQGAAVFGVGLLYDRSGDDLYRGNLYCQGMGYVNGTGLLADMAGDDTFVSGYSVPDRRENKGAFQTYSQGFGLGCRNFAAGGTGILYDGAGNDTYTGSYFCQGAAYWQALGVLYDQSGDDRYRARRYAQGAGIHLAAGLLLDGRGNDRYDSWGVSQGCGHDDAVGVLRDFAGQDRYQSEWLSQGAGNSRGIGLLADDGGNDVFAATGAHAQGVGVYDERRDALSVGILIDHRGTDRFSTEVTAGRPRKNGEIGAVLDNTDRQRCALPAVRVSESTPGRTVTRAVPLLWRGNLAELEQDLFSERAQKAAAEKLYARGPEIIPRLLSYLDIKDVSVHRTVEKTLKKFAEERIETLIQTAMDSETSGRQTALLLYVLGDAQDLKTEKIFMDFLNHRDSKIKAMALRGLMKLRICPPAAQCAELAQSEDAVVRKYLARCLAYADTAATLRLLGRFLNDDDFNVRYAAGQSFRQRPAEAVSVLNTLLEKKEFNEMACQMVEAILESVGRD